MTIDECMCADRSGQRCAQGAVEFAKRRGNPEPAVALAFRRARCVDVSVAAPSSLA
jgi:hypothetical protein